MGAAVTAAATSKNVFCIRGRQRNKKSPAFSFLTLSLSLTHFHSLSLLCRQNFLFKLFQAAIKKWNRGVVSSQQETVDDDNLISYANASLSSSSSKQKSLSMFVRNNNRTTYVLGHLSSHHISGQSYERFTIINYVYGPLQYLPRGRRRFVLIQL